MDTMYPEFKPTMYITSKDLPALKDFKIGDEYELLVKVKVKSINMNERSSSCDLEITGIMLPEENEDINSMDNKEFEKYAANKKREKYS